MSTPPRNELMQAMSRGLRGRCPHCGTGHIFYRYLKVSPNCPVCQLDLDRYPSDDGPAYFTILLVGHLVVAPMLFMPAIWQAPIWMILPATLIPLTGVTLAMLPRTKGAVIGALYALGVNREDAALHTADRLD